MRIHPLLPLLLSTTAALPAAAADYSFCLTAPDSVSCIIEQAEFTRQRNAEIDASIARVERARSQEAAQNVTHCKTPFSRSPRCLAERAQHFAARQNALAAASIARVAEVRAFEAARNAEITASIAAVEALRTRRLERQQNALIEASIAATNAERQRRFAAEQNALATASIERVAAERQRQLALQLSPCSSSEDNRPRCEAQRARDLAAQQNALATASLQRVREGRARAFAAARNAEAAASIAAVARERAGYSQIETASTNAEGDNWYAAVTSHCARAPSSPRCEAQRTREFSDARNAEINASLAAVAAARASGRLANGARANDGNPLETGAIGTPSLRKMRGWTGEPENELRHDISTDPCAAKPFDAVQFVRGASIDAEARPELDRLVKVASACPGMRIEVHGYTDGGSVLGNRNLSQARAQAIADYLIAAGVAPNRVAAIGRGGRHPVMLYGKSFAPGYGRAELVIKDPGTDAAARRVMWDLAELLDPTYIPAVANLSP